MNRHLALSIQAAVPHGSLADAGRQARDLERIIRARGRRRQFFRTRLFSDPAWDMLLKLAQAGLEQHRITVSELCAAADAPYTTCLRYIQAMVDEGLVERLADPLDCRRKFLSLTPAASKQMSDYLDMPGLADLKAA